MTTFTLTSIDQDRDGTITLWLNDPADGDRTDDPQIRLTPKDALYVAQRLLASLEGHIKTR